MWLRVCSWLRRSFFNRRIVPCQGHFRYKAKRITCRAIPRTYLNNFLPVSLIFSAGHRFFLLMIIKVLTVNGKGAMFEVG